MAQDHRLRRNRTELAEFLRNRRAAVTPGMAGLAASKRRRTPGLRREEVAMLAGVGLSWYTWLEQGRDINVSVAFLENVARALGLTEIERRHLFLLAHRRPPPVLGQTGCRISPLVRKLLDDLPLRPAYILNLHWDVIAWNRAANILFGFDDVSPEQRNMMWLLFANDQLNRRIANWSEQAGQVLSSFRRDVAQNPNDEILSALIKRIQDKSTAFVDLWHHQTGHVRCQGTRCIDCDMIGPVGFDHATFVVDEEKHLRMVVYAAMGDDQNSMAFQELCLQVSVKQKGPIPEDRASKANA
tara:strand:- start:19613 stop:20509 length:897 start_codon:yes stop_codon:yes gene_type:complete